MTKTQLREKLQNEIAELEAVIDTAGRRLDKCYSALEVCKDMRAYNSSRRNTESRAALVMALIGKPGLTFKDLKTQAERRKFWRVEATIRNHEKYSVLEA
jgi:hypothetical protein